MNAIPQQVIARQKAAVNALVAAQTAVFGGFEKLVDLNLKVVKASLDEAAQRTHQSVEIKDAQEAVALASSLVQPGTEKALAYGKHVFDIISGVQAELTKLTEAQVAEGRQQLVDSVEQLVRNAPAGSEGAVSLLKSSLATANSTYESISKAAKQAAEVAETNLNAAANATFKAASDAAEAAAKAAPRAASRAA